jgi:hypothetical protein
MYERLGSTTNRRLSAERPRSILNPIWSLRVKVISMGQVVAPTLAVVTITGLRSTFPFDDLTFRNPTTSARTLEEPFDDRWKGWSSKVA